jgi:putative ABC transport system ATP-binding protein
MRRMRAPIIDLEGVERVRGSAGEPFRLRVERLAIGDGERVALLGPSGCGKSTCLDLLAMTLRPTTAATFLLRVPGEDEVDIASWWARGERGRLTRVRARHFGYVLQTGGLLPFLSIWENVLVSRRLLGLPCPGPAMEILRFLGIAHLAQRTPATVSIGERQRAAVARAIAHKPKIVLADEPTASLDPGNAEKVMDMFVRLAAELGLTLVLVSHDHDLVKSMGLRAIECAVEAGETVIRDTGA